MPRRLEKLGPRHQMAVEMRAAGRSPAEIAEVAGVRLQTVYLWFGDPLVKDALATATRRLAASIEDRLTAGALVALRELESLTCGDHDPEVRLQAARELLDRCADTIVKDADSIAVGIRRDLAKFSDQQLLVTANSMLQSARSPADVQQLRAAASRPRRVNGLPGPDSR